MSARKYKARHRVGSGTGSETGDFPVADYQTVERDATPAGLWREEWASRRRSDTVERFEAVALAWPATTRERRKTFEHWEGIAMRALRHGRSGFALIIGLRKVLPTDGQITATNAELACAAGFCSIKTVDREIKLLKRLGLLAVATRGRRRVIRLSVPADGLGGV
jgi:hypothetical protein